MREKYAHQYEITGSAVLSSFARATNAEIGFSSTGTVDIESRAGRGLGCEQDQRCTFEFRSESDDFTYSEFRRPLIRDEARCNLEVTEK